MVYKLQIVVGNKGGVAGIQVLTERHVPWRIPTLQDTDFYASTNVLKLMKPVIIHGCFISVTNGCYPKTVQH